MHSSTKRGEGVSTTFFVSRRGSNVLYQTENVSLCERPCGTHGGAVLRCYFDAIASFDVNMIDMTSGYCADTPMDTARAPPHTAGTPQAIKHMWILKCAYMGLIISSLDIYSVLYCIFMFWWRFNSCVLMYGNCIRYNIGGILTQLAWLWEGSEFTGWVVEVFRGPSFIFTYYIHRGHLFFWWPVFSLF